MAKRGSAVPRGGRWARWALRLLAGVLLLIGLGRPAEADPPGVMTVADWRHFLAMVEQDYDARMSRAVASFYAAGAATQGYLLTGCLREQTVGELSAWLRTTAPAKLTLLEALRLNARQHGCEARDPADVDAELAIQPWRQP